MKKIWIDIDDVMNDFITYIIDELNLYTWKEIHISEIKTWHLNKIWWISFEELQNIYKKSDIYTKVPLLENNIKIIKQLEKNWYEICFITSRFLFDDYNTTEITKNIFLKNGLKNKIYIWMGKAEICKKLWIDIFIDDALYNCLKVKNENNNIQVFLLEKIWNGNNEIKRLKEEWFNIQNIWNIKRILNFKDILTYI